jgi:hypothetical protein
MSAGDQKIKKIRTTRAFYISSEDENESALTHTLTSEVEELGVV